ncbi:hypothetical protein C8J57DRAFT_1216849 [Mycena rebaudengoi]|nr:hypothetical protein C8J57DRAFT_1216849 [Mycena rebaudengoi]
MSYFALLSPQGNSSKFEGDFPLQYHVTQELPDSGINGFFVWARQNKYLFKIVHAEAATYLLLKWGILGEPLRLSDEVFNHLWMCVSFGRWARHRIQMGIDLMGVLAIDSALTESSDRASRSPGIGTITIAVLGRLWWTVFEVVQCPSTTATHLFISLLKFFWVPKSCCCNIPSGPALPPSHEAKGGVDLAENAGDSPLVTAVGLHEVISTD